MKDIFRLRNFVQSFTHLIEQVGCNNEEKIFEEGKELLTNLVSHDDWLPEQFSQPSLEHYEQYLLYCDPMERFSVVSFVWGPGQTTPVHDHTVWGMVGLMRGSELCEEFETNKNGEVCLSDSHTVMVGEVDLVSPRIGDVHKVSNALEHEVSISIHVYGANIGAVKRTIYTPNDGSKQMFISGYTSDVIPNIWKHSIETTS